MEACVSVHKESKSDKVVIPEPIKKEKPIINGDDSPIAEAGLKSQWSLSHPVTTVRDLGSKEETFFDSQAWLESDCDDDFLSVNGDFTPSRGSSPGHQSFFARTPRVNKASFDDKKPGSKPEQSPTSQKKKLSELFLDSLRINHDIDVQNLSGNNQNGVVGDKGFSPRPANGTTPFVSAVLTSERIPNGHYTPEKEKQPIKPLRGCLPRMLSTRSNRERRKKMNPTPRVAPGLSKLKATEAKFI